MLDIRNTVLMLVLSVNTAILMGQSVPPLDKGPKTVHFYDSKSAEGFLTLHDIDSRYQTPSPTIRQHAADMVASFPGVSVTAYSLIIEINRQAHFTNSIILTSEFSWVTSADANPWLVLVHEALHIGLNLNDSDLAKTLFGATFVDEGAASGAITKWLANDCKHQWEIIWQTQLGL